MSWHDIFKVTFQILVGLKPISQLKKTVIHKIKNYPIPLKLNDYALRISSSVAAFLQNKSQICIGFRFFAKSTQMRKGHTPNPVLSIQSSISLSQPIRAWNMEIVTHSNACNCIKNKTENSPWQGVYPISSTKCKTTKKSTYKGHAHAQGHAL